MFSDSILNLQRRFSNSVNEDPILVFCFVFILFVILIILTIHIIRLSTHTRSLENEMYSWGRQLVNSVLNNGALANAGALERFLSVQSPKEVAGFVSILLRELGYRDTRTLFAFSSNRVVRKLVSPSGSKFGLAHMRRNQPLDDSLIRDFHEDLLMNDCTEGMIIHLGGKRRIANINLDDTERSYKITVATGEKIFDMAVKALKGGKHTLLQAEGTTS